MLVYRIMSLNKHQQNYLLERLSYKNSYKTHPDLTSTFMNQKKLNLFLFTFFSSKTNLIAGYIYIYIYIYINVCTNTYTFKDYYLNPFLVNSSKESNKAIAVLGHFSIGLLSFNTSEDVRTCLDDLASSSLPEI